MKEEVVFYERQRLNRWWIGLMFVLVNALLIYGCIVQLCMGEPWGNNPADNTALIIITVVVMLLTVSLFFVSLNTVINQEGIYIKIFPFFLRYKFFPWDMISKSYIRKYNPVLEYGGWGIRHSSGMFKLKIFSIRRIMNPNNIAYNVSGNMGLQLELINGKRVLIGTRNPVELEEVLRKLNKIQT